jgi:hypothetical protein
MDLEKTRTADSFIGTMAEKLGAVARAATIFGEPVQRDAITVNSAPGCLCELCVSPCALR